MKSAAAGSAHHHPAVALASRPTTGPARLSTRLSAPKPISAIEEAAIPAPIAIPNSTTCQPIPSQARALARRTSPIGCASETGDGPTARRSAPSAELLVVDRLEVLRLGLRLGPLRLR